MTKTSLFSSDESLEDGLRKIEDALKVEPKPDAKPKKLMVKQVQTRVSVFQPRSLNGRFTEDETHIENLMDAIGTKGAPKVLDAITIWWAGFAWVCIDGHHRLEAYRRLDHHDFTIPVSIHSGTLAEAMAYAIAANSKDHLVMRKDEKLQAAWKLVLTTDLTKEQIATACSIGTTTVANMRKKKKEAKSLIDTFELADKPWKIVARMTIEELVTGVDLPGKGEWSDDKTAKLAEVWAHRLHKTFGDKLYNNSEAFAQAIHLYHDKLPMSLLATETFEEQLEEQTKLDDDLEELEEQGFDPVEA